MSRSDPAKKHWESLSRPQRVAYLMRVAEQLDRVEASGSDVATTAKALAFRESEASEPKVAVNE